MREIPVAINGGGGVSEPLSKKAYTREAIKKPLYGFENGTKYFLKQTDLVVPEMDNSVNYSETIYSDAGDGYNYNIYLMADGLHFSIYEREPYINESWSYNETNGWLVSHSNGISAVPSSEELEHLYFIFNNKLNPDYYNFAKLNQILENPAAVTEQIIGYKKITLEEKVKDLQNWDYDKPSYQLKKNIDFSEIEFPEPEDGDENSYITIYENDDDLIELVFEPDTDTKGMGVWINNEHYLYFDTFVLPQDVISVVSFEEKKWYNVTEMPTEVSAPLIELDESKIVNKELLSLIADLICKTLKEKFEEIEQKIESHVDATLLKDKVYDMVGDDELIAGEVYQLKNDFTDFFDTYNVDFDIYALSFTPAPDLPIGNGGAIPAPDLPAETEEVILGITYHASKNSDFIKEITVYSSTREYTFNNIDNKWKVSGLDDVPYEELPKLTLITENIRNEAALKEILVMLKEQTLKEKIEDLPNWLYDKATVESGYKPIFDILPILMQNGQLFFDAGLFENQERTLLYLNENWQLLYTFNQNDGITKFEWVKAINYPDEMGYYELTITEGRTELTVEWKTYVAPWDLSGLITTPETINSQDELPIIDNYNPEGINPDYSSIVPLLVAKKTGKDITLKERIEKPLKEWNYGTEEKEIVNFENGKEYKIRSSINFEMPSEAESDYTIATDANGVWLGFYENNDSLYLNLWSENNFDLYYVPALGGWISYDGTPYTEELTFVVNTSGISDDTLLKEILIDAKRITLGEKIDTALKNWDNKVTIKEKIETCLTLVRLSNVEINTIVPNTYNEYAEYPYMAEIEDDSFKDALKVEVLFTLSQLDSGNFCSLQEIDTQNGILILFLKANNANIILNRIDIFKYVKAEVEQETVEPEFERI